MFAGHIGAALAIGRVEPRLNIGVVVAAALGLDLMLWIFVLLGWESVTIPPDYSATHQVAYLFPYSHGLLASLAWALLVAAAARAITSSWRIAAVLAAAVYSHWVLDALVHRPELPLAGAGSGVVGLGLWQWLPFALGVEAALVIAGVAAYLVGSGWTRARATALVVLSLVVLAFTVVGMTLAPPPPSAAAMAGSSLITLAMVCALYGWIGRRPRP